MTKRWRWLLAAAAVTAVVLIGPPKRVEACLFGTCDAIIISNQVVQIGHMVTQIANMVDQLSGLTSIDEILTTDLSGVGNMGRLRELRDQDFWRRYLGNGLARSTSLGGPGLYSQRLPGESDEAGWLDILAAPRLGDPTSSTVLLGGRPATETTAAEPSRFRTWPVPSGAAWSNPARNAARQAIDVLGDVAEGTATWRTVWDDIEAALPNAIRPADIRALNLGTAAETRLIRTWRQRERQAGTELQHAHAMAEAASALQGQVGETAAHLGELRDDDLMREERLNQAVLANGVTQTELLLAQAQVIAQQQAAAARERYEAEQRRREELARWQAGMVAGQAAWDARRADIIAGRATGIAAARRLPNPSTW